MTVRDGIIGKEWIMQRKMRKKKSLKSLVRQLEENPSCLIALRDYLKQVKGEVGGPLEEAMDILQKAVEDSEGKKLIGSDPLPTLPFYALNDALTFYEDVQKTG